jgi:hypothetical protein
MIWKIPAFGLVLWLVQYFFHLNVAMTVLVGLVTMTALIAMQLRASHKTLEVKRSLSFSKPPEDASVEA